MTEKTMIYRAKELLALRRFAEAQKILDTFEIIYGRGWVQEQFGRN